MKRADWSSDDREQWWLDLGLIVLRMMTELGACLVLVVLLAAACFGVAKIANW
jgi:hypothetical protein